MDEDIEEIATPKLKKIRGRPIKPPSNAKWTDYSLEDLKLLIGFVADNDVLWDSSKSQFHRKETTNPIWHKIEKRVKFIRNDGHQYGGSTRKLFDQLISRFKFYHAKMNKPLSGQLPWDLPEVLEEFPLYEEMSFYERNLVQRAVETTWQSVTPKAGCKRAVIADDSDNDDLTPGIKTKLLEQPEESHFLFQSKKRETKRDRFYDAIERSNTAQIQMMEKLFASNITSPPTPSTTESGPLVELFENLKLIYTELEPIAQIDFKSRITVEAIKIRDEYQRKKLGNVNNTWMDNDPYLVHI